MCHRSVFEAIKEGLEQAIEIKKGRADPSTYRVHKPKIPYSGTDANAKPLDGLEVVEDYKPGDEFNFQPMYQPKKE